MESIRVRKIYTNELSRICFYCLFILFWCEHTVFNYAIQIFRRIPIIGQFYLGVIPFFTLILLVLSFPYLMKGIKGEDILFYCVCIIVILLTMVVFPKNAPYIQKDLWKIIGMTIPLYFIGLRYDHNRFKEILYYASLIGVILTFLYQIYYLSSGRELNPDNMGAAYNLLPSLLYLIYGAFEKKKLLYWIIVIVSFPIIFIFGTRGPMLTCVVFFVVEMFIKVISNKSFLLKFLFFCFCIGAFWFVFYTDAIFTLAKFLSDKFKHYGFSTRIFDFFLKGDIALSTGRDNLQNSIIHSILKFPVFGDGLMGDRVISGNYVHNLFLEIWCDFGVVIGTGVLFVLICIPVKALYKERSDSWNFYFILMLVCLVFTKLMLSGSYITEPYLFLLLGLCVGTIRKNKKNSLCVAYYQ